VTIFGGGLFLRRGESTFTPVALQGDGARFLQGVSAGNAGLVALTVSRGLLDGRKGGPFMAFPKRKDTAEFNFPTDIGEGPSGLVVTTTDGVLTRPSGSSSWTRRRVGFRAEYVYAFALGTGGSEWFGHLHGLDVITPGGAVRHVGRKDGLPDEHVRDIVVRGDRVLVATDDGAGLSDDGGRSWRTLRSGAVSASKYVMAVELAGEWAWLGTAAGLMRYSVGGETSGSLCHGPTPRASFVTCVEESAGGELLVGTAAGLWGVTPSTASATSLAPLCTADSRFIETELPAWPRPIGASDNAYLDQTYPYGATWAGQFQVHNGVEFNNPEGTKLLAVAPGVVAFVGAVKHGTNAIIIRHDQRVRGLFAYTVYLHLSRQARRLGDKVQVGDLVGYVGHTGHATNDHLHFEVRLTATETDGIGQPAYNPGLLLRRVDGTGAVVARVTDKSGAPIPGATLTGLVVLGAHESPHAVAESYGAGANRIPGLDENLAVVDVPPGLYPVRVTVGKRSVDRCVRVEAGRTSQIDVRL
jgi:hypothetical protein